jgi:predicted metal-dependent hydrolase
VILHELAHLKIPDHGPDFKAILSAYMPDWKARRNLLNE